MPDSQPVQISNSRSIDPTKILVLTRSWALLESGDRVGLTDEDYNIIRRAMSRRIYLKGTGTHENLG